MNKKGLTNVQTTVLIISGIILVLIGIFVLIAFANDDNVEIPKKVNNITMYLNAKSNDNQIESNFLIVQNETIFLYGKTSEDSLTELKVPGKETHIYCYEKGYYSDQINKTFSVQELSTNISTITTCNPEKAEELKINYTKNFVKNIDAGNIRFVLKSKNFHDLSGAVFWSPSIIDVTLPQMKVSCINWTKEENLYRCQNGGFYECSEITKDKECLLNEETPNRYLNADSVFTTGYNLINSSITLDFKIRTVGNINDNACITFIFYDKDVMWNKGVKLLSELNNQNIGVNKDFPIVICPD